MPFLFFFNEILMNDNKSLFFNLKITFNAALEYSVVSVE